MKKVLPWLFFVFSASVLPAQPASIDSLAKNYPIVFTGKVKEAFNFGMHDLGTYRVHIKVTIDQIYKTSWVIPETIEFTVSFSNFRGDSIDPEALESYFDRYRSPTIFFLPNLVFEEGGTFRNELEMISLSKTSKAQIENATVPYRKDISQIPFYQKDSTECTLCKFAEAGTWNRVEREIKRVLKRSWRSDKMNKQDVYDWLGSKPCVKYLYTDVICLTLFPMTCGFGVVFQTPEGLEERYVSIRYGKIYRLFGLTLGSAQNAKKFLGMGSCRGCGRQYAESFRTNFVNTVSVVYAPTVTGADYPLPDLAYFHHAYLEGSQYSYLNHSYFQDKWMSEIKRLETEGYVYHLCLLSLHTDQSVQMAALESLKRLDDPRAIPYLLKWADYQSILYLPPQRDIPEHQAYCMELVRTINALTGLRLPAETVPFNQVNYGQRLIQTALPSWRAQIMNGELEIPN